MFKCFKKKKARGMSPESRKNVFEQLKIDEGIKYEIYLDHLGYETFGVGHLITESDEEYGLPVGTEVSEERVWSVFDRDLDFYIAECEVLYGEEVFARFPSEVQEILVNMCFNMGRTRLSQFRKMNHALHMRNWELAAQEGRDSRWYRQVTNRAERLMSRLENV